MTLDKAITAQKLRAENLLYGVAAIGADPLGIKRYACLRGEEGLSARYYREAKA
ncbi:MAG: hypothetical protein INF84_10130 [Roseomonas sp.]|jgi:hypothetical protein|nr:hypothetical protein [Roseomonas sp.]